MMFMPQSHTLCLFVVFLILFIWLRVFFIATYELLVAACGIQFPNQGANPGPLHWQHGLSPWAAREVPIIQNLETVCLLTLPTRKVNGLHKV